MPYVYILKTGSGKYYIGCTVDIGTRIVDHKKGYSKSTKALGVPELIFSQEYCTLGEARKIEKKLKNLKRRDYIQKIIEDGYIKLK